MVRCFSCRTSNYVLGPLVFLAYINDLPENHSSEVKLFTDDISLFSVVKNELSTGLELNKDLEKVKMWAWQWKMQFNADKTEEVLFSWQKSWTRHPVLKVDNDEITISLEHKHLGMTQDHKLHFQSHIRDAILKARGRIGMIKYLSKYISREVVDQVYKLYKAPLGLWRYYLLYV